MNYRDAYPSCADCPFLQMQQTQRDDTRKDIQDGEIHIAAKQAALDHYIEMSLNISTYTLLQLMAAKEHGVPDEELQPLIDSVDAYDKDAAIVENNSASQIAAAHTYIETSNSIIELTDAITQKVASDCPGYSIQRYLGQKGCKSSLIPFVDTDNK